MTIAKGLIFDNASHFDVLAVNRHIIGAVAKCWKTSASSPVVFILFGYFFPRPCEDTRCVHQLLSTSRLLHVFNPSLQSCPGKFDDGARNSYLSR
jgi:hypothetical protein